MPRPPRASRLKHLGELPSAKQSESNMPCVEAACQVFWLRWEEVHWAIV